MKLNLSGADSVWCLPEQQYNFCDMSFVCNAPLPSVPKPLWQHLPVAAEQTLDFLYALLRGKKPAWQVGRKPCLCSGPLVLLLTSFLGLSTWAGLVSRRALTPTVAPSCPKSLSCSACGPISIATSCDASEESRSFKEGWGKGAGDPFIAWEHGSRGLRSTHGDGLACWLR